MAQPAKLILWVDDEADMLEPHRMFLRDKGFEVETARNADDAVEMVRRRPFSLVLLDEQNAVAHMLATCPQAPKRSGQAGGDICEKTTPMSPLSFAPGIGTPVLRVAGSPALNDVTSTKQNLTAAMGLVVLASNTATRAYWSMSEPLGG